MRRSLRPLRTFGVVLLASLACSIKAFDGEGPDKTEWKKYDATIVRGKVSTFSSHRVNVYRSRGKVCVNGRPPKNADQRHFLESLCRANGLPEGEEELTALLIKQPYAGQGLQYNSVWFVDPDSGEQIAVPTIMLDPEEVPVLDPLFQVWRSKVAEENRVAAERARALAEQREIQAARDAVVQAQQDAARAAEKQTEELRKQTRELEELRRSLKKK